MIPLLTLLTIWGVRTVDMYRDLSLRYLGDNRLNGITLHQVGVLQYQYLKQTFRIAALHAIGVRPDNLPRIDLFVQDADIKKLESNRPISGKQYVSARLYNNDKFSRVKARYRGDFAWHWGFFKRSWRIKTKRDDLFMGIRKFNLIIPKTGFLYSNHMGYEMARLIGLIAPQSAMVNLSVNGRHRGIFLLVEQVSESTLRTQNRLPGDIYSGDELFGLDVWYGLEPLFESPGRWQKSAINNHYPDGHNEPIRALVAAVRSEDHQALAELVDLEAFALFNLWEQLALSKHIDDHHNWRLYYDPGRGRFYPILWDGLPWANYWLEDDWRDNWEPPVKLIASKLMFVLHANKEFLRVKDHAFRSFLESDKPTQLIAAINQINEEMARNVFLDTAILRQKDWITPEQSIDRMADNTIIVQRVLDKLRQQYSVSKTPTPSPLQPEAIVWRGHISIDTDTVIEQPLTIVAGSVVTIAEGKSLIIRNRLHVDGRESGPVTITAKQGVFGAIVLEGKLANGSRLNWLSINKGSGFKDDLREFSGMLSIHDVTDVEINHCDLSDNAHFDDQLHVVYSDVTINDCTFTAAPMDAIDLDMSTARISNSTFTGNGNDGLDLMGSKVKARNLTFKNNGDKGISVGERSLLDIEDSDFYDNGFAIQVKDDSLVTARRLSLTRNRTALNAYAKNWRYENGGFGVFCEIDFSENDKTVTTDKTSNLQIKANGCPPLFDATTETIKKLKRSLRKT